MIRSSTTLPHLTSPTPAALAGVARVLATRTEIWRSLVQFTPDDRYYTRFAGGEGWEAWLLAWLPGQGTGWHDHGGSSGAFAVLEGVLEERTPRAAEPAGSRSRSQGYRTAVAPRSLQVSPGQVRSFGPDHLHDVVNSGALPAVSLHVYGPALSTMTRYRPDSSGVLHLLARERAGANW